MAKADVVSRLKSQFPDLGFEDRPLMIYPDGRESEQRWVRVPAERLVEVATFLRDDATCKMEQLCDLTCVDYLNFPEADDRFGVIVSLLSISRNHRIWLKVFVNDPDPRVPTLTGVWKGAGWPEREVFDLFGITFEGHADMRRILCPDWFEHHPLRKDYPLTGVGERESLKIVTRDDA